MQGAERQPRQQIVAGLLKAVKGNSKPMSTLSPTMIWTFEKVCRRPLPIHNYLLISCFVSATVARADEMNTMAVRRERPV